jgi:hypothetical protein
MWRGREYEEEDMLDDLEKRSNCSSFERGANRSQLCVDVALEEAVDRAV